MKKIYNLISSSFSQILLYFTLSLGLNLLVLQFTVKEHELYWTFSPIFLIMLLNTEQTILSLFYLLMNQFAICCVSELPSQPLPPDQIRLTCPGRNRGNNPGINPGGLHLPTATLPLPPHLLPASAVLSNGNSSGSGEAESNGDSPGPVGLAGLTGAERRRERERMRMRQVSRSI